ncbi:unnamed protein product [Gongylonema pulchrum]|uniref:Protein phosphatase methylesterase-1 n=1 Tax=Gongylonema pulchrum TaxID=637853 RepID=A0A183DJX5_9BILA|nr:unnamed protein product [Gongylonema pulchrum]
MRRVMRARKVLPSISEHGSASIAAGAAAAVGPAPMAPGGSPRVVPETSLAPLEWDVFFDKKLDVSISEQDVFCVYTKGDAGPMFFLLHGGGYSGLTWACLTVRPLYIIPLLTLSMFMYLWICFYFCICF